MSKRYPGNFITGNPVALSQTSNSGIWDLKDQYQATANGTWQDADGVYEIPKSLRFRGAATATYLTRTPTISGNRKTWTYSTWVKFGVIGDGYGRHFGMSPQYGGDGANESQINLMTTGTIRAYDAGGGAGYFNVETVALFRDPSAWYHVVVACNTTLAVPTDRVKIYVNGVRQAITTNAQVSQNQNTGWNHTYLHKLGAPGYSGNTNNTWDGHLAEINHIDGQELDPSYFGYFDPITNIWQPKRYTGGYGTNGFYLPFSENQSTAQLGKNFANGSNYLTYSEQFNNAAWSKPAAPVAPTISTDATAAPDGSTTADAVVFSGSTTHPCYQEYTVATAAGQSWTVSMYVKQATGTDFALQCTLFNGSGVLQDGYNNFTFDSATKITSSATNSFMSVGSQYVGNGWHRIWATNTNQSASAGTYIRVSIGQRSAPTAWSIFCWGAQLTLGTTLLPYTQTVASIINNDWTPNNISVTPGATYDSMVDSPTNVFTSATDIGGVVSGNYCTFSPIDVDTSISLTNGNLTASTGNTGVHNNGRMTMGTGTSGFWYMEFTYGSSLSGSTAIALGLYDPAFRIDNGTHPVSSNSGFYGMYASVTSYMYTNGSTGASVAVSTGSAGNTLQLAYDVAGGKLWFGLNNAWYDSSGGTTGNPSTGANPTLTGVATNRVFGYDLVYNTINVNFGQRAFTYAPPTGYKSLNTTNIQALGTAAIGKAAITPNKWMDIVLSGGSTTPRTVSGMQMQPDLVIFKNRVGTSNRRWSWFDSVRGPNAHLTSQNTEAETTSQSDLLTSFNSDGFSVGADAGLYGANGYGEPWAQWAWKQSPTAGFNVVSYTGNNTARSISHNLGVAPKMMIVKQRTSGSTTNWAVYHASLPSAFGVAGTQVIYLNDTLENAQNFDVWESNNPTSSIFSVGASALTNASGGTYIAYLWAEVPGFSKFGSYIGNGGTTEGPFVYTGFRPKFVLTKCATGYASYWTLMDTTRDPFNDAAAQALWPNANDAESAAYNFDILSNGFKIRATTATLNQSAATYIYAAFAESPFGLNNRAR